MSIWDNLCIHAAFHWWNPIRLILRRDWMIEAIRMNDFDYPGWRWR